MSRRAAVTGVLVGALVFGVGFWSDRLAGQRVAAHYDESLLSQPTFSVRMEHHVRVPMRDGVKLSADLYRPDAKGRFPTLLVRTPYSNNSTGAIDQAHYQSLFYAERGYAVDRALGTWRWPESGW